MKKRFTRIASFLLAAVMAFSLAACGGESAAPAQTEAPAAQPAATNAAASADEKITIKITWWGGDARHAYTQELLDKYTELNPNVTFEAIPAGWDGYFEKLSTQAASGSMPDLIQMDYLYISTYAKNNSLADLTPYMESGVIDTTNLDQNILNTGLVNGIQAGMPLSTSILATSYNPSVIEAAGAEIPADDWTWEDYIALNAQVAAANGQPSALAATAGIFGDTNIFNYWVKSHGETLFNENGTGLGFEDDAITAEFFQMWKDMADANVSPDADEQSQIASLGKEGLPIVTGTAATNIEWNNFTSSVRNVNDTLKLALMPSAQDGGLWLKPGMFFSVAETSKVKDACADFINWFINSKEANDIIAGERGTPISSEIRQYMVDSGTLNAQQIDMFNYVDKAAAVAGATPAPDPSGISEVNEAFATAGNSVLYGMMTAEEAAASFREEANAILLRNNG